MSNITLSPAIAAAITEAVALTGKAERKFGSTIDLLAAEGFRSTDFISPKSDASTASPEQWDAINAAIVAGFTKAAQQLLDKPTKSLEDPAKAEKRYWQQQIGAKRNDFKRGLQTREMADNSRAARQPKAAIDKLRVALETVEKIAQANEWEFDVVDFLNCIVQAKIEAGIPHSTK
jgi:outer membrane PBP1 activator LpoA protein